MGLLLLLVFWLFVLVLARKLLCVLDEEAGGYQPLPVLLDAAAGVVSAGLLSR